MDHVNDVNLAYISLAILIAGACMTAWSLLRGRRRR
jgi:hypothetical protein